MISNAMTTTIRRTAEAPTADKIVTDSITVAPLQFDCVGRRFLVHNRLDGVSLRRRECQKKPALLAAIRPGVGAMVTIRCWCENSRACKFLRIL